MVTVCQPPAGLIPVPMKGAVLLLTEPEYLAGIRRGKAWRRREALARRTARVRIPDVNSHGRGSA
jgi:hypothetical protein